MAMINDDDEDMRVLYIMRILMSVDSHMIEAKREWSFEAIEAKETIKDALTIMFGVRSTLVDERYNAGDGSLP